MWGEQKRLEVMREEGGEERSGVQETTGMCRMAGGWPGERTEKKWDCGGVKEQLSHGGTKEETCWKQHVCPLDKVVG